MFAAVLSTAVCGAQSTQADIQRLWDEANQAYMTADYAAAIRAYNAILDAGHSSHKLYYNLGNAYFKEGQMGRAILFYNRALLLRPSDADTKHNLAIAMGYVKDKIDPLPEMAVKRWGRAVRSSMGSNGWAVASLVLLVLALAATLVYLLSERLSRRKAGFYTGLFTLALLLFAVGFSVAERYEILHSSYAIVMTTAVPVKSSPDGASKDIFILHEGTKVNITSSLGEWYEIETANGHKGWIIATAIEIIR